MERKKLFKWRKRVLNVFWLSAALAIVINCVTIYQWLNDKEGTFRAYVKNQEAISPVQRTILVYLDNDSANISQIDIIPQILNPSKYALHDVLLTYTIISDSANISYSNYYTEHKYENRKQITYIDNILFAKSDLPMPFLSFIMKDEGQASIDLRATYKGIEEPFLYQSNIFTKKIINENPNRRIRSIMNHAEALYQNKNISQADIYVLYKDSVATYENLSYENVCRKASINYGRIGGAGKYGNKSISIEQFGLDQNERRLSLATNSYSSKIIFFAIIAFILSLLFFVLSVSGLLLIDKYSKFIWAIIIGVIISPFISVFFLHHLFLLLDYQSNYWSLLMIILFQIITFYFSLWGCYKLFSKDEYLVPIKIFLTIFVMQIIAGFIAYHILIAN